LIVYFLPFESKMSSSSRFGINFHVSVNVSLTAAADKLGGQKRHKEPAPENGYF